jgi:hypothetical protein
MCDAESVQLYNSLHGSDNVICYVTYGLPAYSLVCNILNSSFTYGSITSLTGWSSFSNYYITQQQWDLGSLPVTVQNSDNVACWSFATGQVECANIQTGVQVPLHTDSRARYSQVVVSDSYATYIDPSNGSVSYFSFTAAPQNSFTNAFSAERLWGGPFRVCAASNTTVECVGSLTSFSEEVMDPTGYGMYPMTDMAIHTTTNFWVNGGGQYGQFGVYNCSDTNANPSQCVPFASELGLAESISGPFTATAVAVGASRPAQRGLKQRASFGEAHITA